MNTPLPYSKKKLDDIKEQLVQSFTSGQGMVMGLSAVVSRKVHLEPPHQPGLVHILTEKDAGKTYLGQVEYDKIVHIDVFHCPAEIDIVNLENHIRKSVYPFLQVINSDNQTLPDDQLLVEALKLAGGIYLVTGSCEGTLPEPHGQVYLPPIQYDTHVHILAKMPPKYYSFIYCIIEETEKALTYQGVKLRPVRQIIHIHAKTRHLPPGTETAGFH